MIQATHDFRNIISFSKDMDLGLGHRRKKCIKISAVHVPANECNMHTGIGF